MWEAQEESAGGGSSKWVRAVEIGENKIATVLHILLLRKG